VRAAAPCDLPAILAIQTSSPEAAQWEVSQYLAYHLRVAVSPSGLAGFVVARTLVRGESEILNLAVAPEFRRQGVARALIEGWLRDFPGTVFLEVRASNKTAQKAYKCLGFQELITRPEYYDSGSESGIVMKFHSC
jgi:ribosomal-protein-alanine N-acetyltransferase